MINYYTDWRWTFYMLLIWSATELALIIAFVPETYEPVLLRRKAIRLRAATGDTRLQAPIERLQRSVAGTVLWSCIRPFQLLFSEPMCFSLCLLTSLLLGILYLFFGAFPLVFGVGRGWNLAQIGLSFIGIMVGMMLGIVTDPIWKRQYVKLVRRKAANAPPGSTPDAAEPEFRLPPTIWGAWLVPVGLIGGW